MGDIAAGLAIGLSSAVLFYMQACAGLRLPTSSSSGGRDSRESTALLNQ